MFHRWSQDINRKGVEGGKRREVRDKWGIKKQNKPHWRVKKLEEKYYVILITNL